MKTMRVGRGWVGPAMLAWGLLVLGVVPVAAQYGAQNGEWRSYGGDVGSTKYSPLDLITRDNFEDLELVWRWSSVDDFLSMTTPDGGELWADYETIIGQLESDTPNLYRDRNRPNRSNLQEEKLSFGHPLLNLECPNFL